ncbi:TPA_asm: hypothetical protein GB206_16745 [Salmonella enterica subsp. enterica serovar Agona]|nr:hypothetical protein [Salmonella enterica subsp. enterica serovar Agona]
MMFLKDRHTFCSASIFSLQMLAIMPSSGGLPTFMLRREKQNLRFGVQFLDGGPVDIKKGHLRGGR